MKIKRLVIENFKSIERIELIDPNPFTVFVGPNGSGKSNIFEALEYVNFSSKNKSNEVDEFFGGEQIFINRNKGEIDNRFDFTCQFENFESIFRKFYNKASISAGEKVGLTKLPSSNNSIDFAVEVHKGDETFITSKNFYYNFEDGTYFDETIEAQNYNQFFEGYSRLFIGKFSIEKVKRNSSVRLSLSADNLEKVLKRILTNPVLRDEIFEWLELFVPGFKAVEVDDRDELHWFEESAPNYFTKDLISDGTYNILALLTAIYQSDDKPQFLCIEEPENGLNPKVVKELVNLCRYACDEFGHYIWLNTHSQTLVSQLTTKEIILVDKKAGSTQIKQIQDMNLHDLPMDEAWLSNALGGGIPW